MKFNSLIYLVLLFGLLTTSCSKEDTDPCENISCVNGGTCINGVCDCPERYTGPDCSREAVPRRMVINSITITNFPATDTDGAGWDFTSGPDIYIQVAKDNIELYVHPTFYQNATPGSLEYTFSDLNIVVVTPTDFYQLVLFDFDDFDADDFMGGFSFTPYQANQDFPTEIIFNGGSIAAKIFVSYEF